MVERRSYPQLETISDATGSIVVGWLAARVLYTKAIGAISDRLGASYATRLKALIEEDSELLYFSDAREMQQYDLLARSAFLRTVVANRRKFSALVMLTWAGDTSPEAQAFSAALGDAVSFLDSADEFEARVLRAAPLARRVLSYPSPEGTRQPASPSPPPAQRPPRAR